MFISNVIDWQVNQTGNKYPRTRYIKKSYVVLMLSNSQHSNLLKHLKVKSNMTSTDLPGLQPAQITPLYPNILHYND
jgi:hypothetical protein